MSLATDKIIARLERKLSSRNHFEVRTQADVDSGAVFSSEMNKADVRNRLMQLGNTQEEVTIHEFRREFVGDIRGGPVTKHTEEHYVQVTIVCVDPSTECIIYASRYIEETEECTSDRFYGDTFAECFEKFWSARMTGGDKFYLDRIAELKVLRDLRLETDSYFSACPRDILQHFVGPMVNCK